MAATAALATTQVTLSVSALLALQRAVGVALLPAQLGVRPQLLKIGEDRLDLDPGDREFLVSHGFLDDNGRVDPDAATILRALSSPDAEVDVSLSFQDRWSTHICMVRRNRLIIAGARCGDRIVLDAFTDLDERDIAELLTDTIWTYLFDSEHYDDDGPGIDPHIVPLDAVYDVVTGSEPDDWSEELRRLGLPPSAASIMQESENAAVGRAEVSVYLNHEGVRTPADTVVRLARTPSLGPVMTSFASDNNNQRWLTIEPADKAGLERAIISAIRSVPNQAWFSHSRSD